MKSSMVKSTIRKIWFLKIELTGSRSTNGRRLRSKVRRRHESGTTEI